MASSSNSAPDGRSQPVNFKVVLLGEGAVGKTSLVLRYVDNKFNDKHVSTLQVIAVDVARFPYRRGIEIVVGSHS